MIDYLSEARGWGVTCANELDVGRTHMGCTRATFSWTTDNTNLCHLRSAQVTSDSMGSELKGIGLRLEIATSGKTMHLCQRAGQGNRVRGSILQLFLSVRKVDLTRDFFVLFFT